MSSIDNKMWEIKLELKKIRKATKGFKFKYTSLPDVEKNLRPLLVDKKIGYKFSLQNNANDTNVLSLKIFEVGTALSEIHSMAIPKGVSLAGMNDYQALGSGITYFRRYLLVTAFGIITDEDVDALQPAATPPPKIDYVAKVKQLISIGRPKATLEKYLSTYSVKMNDAEKKEIIALILTVK